MPAFSNEILLQIWETSLSQHPIDRALTILAAFFPGQLRHDLAKLSIGQRDGYLLTAYEHCFGSHVAGQAACPACQQRVEFTLEIPDIRLPPFAQSAAEPFRLEADDYQLTFRLPNSFDLVAILQSSSSVQAQQILMERCLLHVNQAGERQAGERQAGEAIKNGQLPEWIVTQIAAQIAKEDPQAEIELALICPHCMQQWPLLFDIVSFFWAKIDTQARRLLNEVDQLARAYGWAETDILAMSATRRQFYLDRTDTR